MGKKDKGGKSKRPANDRKKHRMNMSFARANTRRLANGRKQAEAHRANLAAPDALTPWQRACAARADRRAAERRTNPGWKPVEVDQFGFIMRIRDGKVTWEDQRRDKTRHRHMSGV